MPAKPLPKEECEDQEEKARLIAQVLELQNTLDGMRFLTLIWFKLINLEMEKMVSSMILDASYVS